VGQIVGQTIVFCRLSFSGSKPQKTMAPPTTITFKPIAENPRDATALAQVNFSAMAVLPS
jgi:hypothetical protein